MNKRDYRNGLICAMIGSVLTMIGDFLIGANPAADVPTGVAIIDLYGDCLRNSDLRMMAGGMLGVIGMPLTGVGYYRIYEAFIKKEGGIPAFLYKLAALACIGLGGEKGKERAHRRADPSRNPSTSLPHFSPEGKFSQYLY